MDPLTLEHIKAWPKAELHLHLDGSLRPETMVELALEYRKPLPAMDAAGLAQAVRAIDDAGSLEAYLAWFDVTLQLMQTRDALIRVAEELVEDAAAENVVYLEVRFSPLLHVDEGLTLEGVVQAVLEGLRRGTEKHGTRANLILCALRGKHAEESLQVAQLASAYRGRGVVAFDLAGPEAGHPAREHLDAFHHARANLVGLTIHAGESWGPTSVRQALLVCGAHRIGHGIATVLDADLLEYVVQHQIPLEVCPTSNVQTQVASDYAAHPIVRLTQAGASVSINTDSRLFSSRLLSEEILRVHDLCGLDANTVRECVRNGFRHAFLPPAVRAGYLENLELAFQA